MVPRYFQNLRYRDRLFREEECDELPNATEARDYAMQAARDLIANGRLQTIGNWLECVFEITDEEGRTVVTLAFTEAATAT